MRERYKNIDWDVVAEHKTHALICGGNVDVVANDDDNDDDNGDNNYEESETKIQCC